MNLNFLQELGLEADNDGTSTGQTSHHNSAEHIASYSPVDGKLIGKASVTTKDQYEAVIQTAQTAFKHWRTVPAPQRGEIVRQYGDALRQHKDALGRLVSYEMGKSLQEGWGEVQEMIDICDFAVGLSRQLYGLTMHSERPLHRMYEQWHPMGIVGIISAFNFPVAVWSWNSMIALVCGDVTVWKPSEKAPMCGVACQNIWAKVAKDNDLPEGISSLVNGDYKIGEYMTKDGRVPLVSATGSTRMGKIVAQTVGARLGKSLLELGGNNAIIITETADMDLVLTGALFGAVGTCGQRCTSTRRLIVHESRYNEVRDKLKADGGVLEGPGYESGCYVKPCFFEVKADSKMAQHETFAPILYIMPYSTLEEAIEIQNSVPQGLSSAIMTTNMRESELFLSTAGSDCGIANVNIGTSGAVAGCRLQVAGCRLQVAGNLRAGLPSRVIRPVFFLMKFKFSVCGEA